MEIKDFTVGQRVWVKLTGNRARGKSGNELIQEWEVVSIGRKYIKAKPLGGSDWCGISFEKREYGYSDKFVEKSDYTPCYILYADRQLILDEMESEQLLNKVLYYFRGVGEKALTLEQLREINTIIFGKENDNGER